MGLKVTQLGALCDTSTSFDDVPCAHHMRGSCLVPVAVESDRVCMSAVADVVVVYAVSKKLIF